MSQSDSPESSTHPPQPAGKTQEPPPAPSAAPPPASRRSEAEWTVGDDGVIDEPSDDSTPRFEDEFDPADAP